MLKKILIGAGAAFLALSAAVLAQVVVPQLPYLQQTDIIQVIPNGQPSAQSQYATVPKVTNVTGYYTSTPNAGASYTFTSGITNAAFTPAGTIASLYVTLAQNASDGAVNCLFSTQTITALYLCTASTGFGNCTTTGINNAVTTLSANASACYFYKRTGVGSQAWYRMR